MTRRADNEAEMRDHKITALVDVNALAKAIEDSVRTVLAAHGFQIGAACDVEGDTVWSLEPLAPERMRALLDELGRNAAQACLAPDVIDEIDELACGELRRELDATAKALAEALDLFDASWCPDHGHAPKPEVLARAAALRELVPA